MKLALSAVGFVILICYILGTAHGIHIVAFDSQRLSSEKQNKEDPPRLCRKYSCDKVWFDEVSWKWQRPRPEIEADGIELWKKLHLKDVRNLENAAPNRTVVLLGDSITEGWGRPFFSPFRYKDPEYEHGPVPSGSILAEKVVPFAIGGDRIQDLAYRLFELGGMAVLQTLSPKTVILTIGTNDFGQEEDLSIAAREMEIFLQQLQVTLPSHTHLVLQAPLPRGRMPCRKPGCNDTRTVWDQTNPAYSFHKHLSDVLWRHAHGTSSYLDCSRVFLRKGNKLDLETFSPDVLHLSELGYRSWGSCIQQDTGVSIMKAM